MSKKSPLVSFIAESRSAIETAATVAGRAEAALVTAEAEQAVATADDGKIDPATLYDRTEKAKKVVGVARIEANRAAAKLAELEEQFVRDLQDAAPKAIAALSAAASKRVAELKEQLTKLMHPSCIDDGSLDAFISVCGGVIDRARAEHQIRTHEPELRQGITANIAQILEEAGELL